MVKNILDLANGFLEFANTDIGKIVTQITLLTGLGWGASSLLKVSNILPTAIGQFKNLGTLLTSTTKGASTLSVALKGLTTGGTLLSGAFSVALPVILGVATAIVGVTTAYNKWKELHPSLEEATNQLNSLETQLEENKARLDEINNLSWNDRTSEILAEKDALELQNAELEKNIQLMQKRKEESAIKGANQEQEIYQETRYRTFGQDTTWSSIEEATEAINKIYGEGSNWANFLIERLEAFNVTVEASGDALNNSLIRVLENATNDLNNFGAVTEENNQILQNNIDVIKEQVSYYSALEETGYTLEPSQRALIDALENYNSVSTEAIQHTEWLSNNVLANASSVNELKNKFPELSSAISESNGVIGVNVEKLFSQQNQTVETKKELAKLVAQELVFNQTGLSVSQQVGALLKIATAAGVAGDALQYYQLAQSGDPRARQEIARFSSGLKENFMSLIDSIDVASNEVNNSILDGTSSASSASKQLTDEALERFKLYYTDLQHLRDMDEIDEEEYLNRLRILVDDYTKDATANMKEYGTNSKEIARNMYQYEEELLDGWKQLQEEKVKAAEEAQKKLIESLEDQASIYEKLFNYMSNQIDKEIEKLEEQRSIEEQYWDDKINALQAQNDEIERQIQLEDLQKARASAQQQQMLVYKDGRFQYVQNVEAISEAETELEAFEREEALRQEVENLELLKEQALASIDQQIAGWEQYKEQWSSVIDNYQEEQDRLLIEQQLGIELEGEMWKLRLDNLSTYVSEYEALMARIAQAQSMSFSIAGGAGGGGSWEVLAGGNSSGFGGRWDSMVSGGGGGGGSNQSFVEDIMSMPGYNESGSGIDIGDWYDPSLDYSQIYQDAKENGASQDILDQIEDMRDQKVDEVYGGVDPNPDWKYASGTLSAHGGLSLVGEKGPELRILGQGDGIIPANATKNLMEISKYSLKDLLKTNAQNVYSYMFDKLVLPNVSDAKSFVNELKRFKQYVYQQ